MIKKTLTKKNIKKDFINTLKWQNFIFLTLAGIINAIGITMFLVPLKLIDSGLSGTSFLLNQITPPFFTLSFFLIVLNIPFFAFGAKKMGFAFTVYSIYTIAIYSISAFLIQKVIPIDVSTSSPIAGSDILLCAIFGGVLSGIGSGLTIRFGGAIDGIEVMAVIFAKLIGLSVGTFVMLYNILLYITSAIIFGSWLIPLYSLIAYAIGIKAVDFIVDGFDKAKGVMIITNKESKKYNEIAKLINENLGRSVTIIKAKGFYSKEDKVMLYCVIDRFQIGKLKKIVYSIDPTSFVTVNEISETISNGSKMVKFKWKKTAPSKVSTQNLKPVVSTTEALIEKNNLEVIEPINSSNEEIVEQTQEPIKENITN